MIDRTTTSVAPAAALRDHNLNVAHHEIADRMVQADTSSRRIRTYNRLLAGAQAGLVAASGTALALSLIKTAGSCPTEYYQSNTADLTLIALASSTGFFLGPLGAACANIGAGIMRQCVTHKSRADRAEVRQRLWSLTKMLTVLSAGMAAMSAALPKVQAQFTPHPMDPRLPIQCPWPMCFRSHSRDQYMVQLAGELVYNACMLTGVGPVLGAVACTQARKQAETVEQWAINRDIAECQVIGCGPVYSL